MDEMLKFLDCAAAATQKKAEELSNLDEKYIYHEQTRKLRDARHTLLKEHFAFEDWQKTGIYEVPQIKFDTITIPIRRIR